MLGAKPTIQTVHNGELACCLDRLTSTAVVVPVGGSDGVECHHEGLGRNLAGIAWHGVA